MPLTVGSRLGHYDVTALIGEGGMGQVYQATDTKLNRQVALKILPEAFASDPDRLARFQREAQVLASLNHPNIAAVLGLEESEGIKAQVLELVEGPTLADRIAEGPILIDEALAIVKEVEAALEAAHRHGIVHGDFTPSDVTVTNTGQVKVSGFGWGRVASDDPQVDTEAFEAVCNLLLGMEMPGTAASLPTTSQEARSGRRRIPLTAWMWSWRLAAGLLSFALVAALLSLMRPQVSELDASLRSLVWVDRAGNEEPIDAESAAYANPRLSPDGSRVAVQIDSEGHDIWILDLVRKTSMPLTSARWTTSGDPIWTHSGDHTSIPSDTQIEFAADTVPLWIPSGDRLVFASERVGSHGLFSKAAGHPEQPKLILSTADRTFEPYSWSGNGQGLIASASHRVGGTNIDIGIISMGGEPIWRPLLAGSYTETDPAISPDGRWLAYISRESGESTVYVRPFPDVERGRWQVSAGSGEDPLWSPDGRTLFYRSPAGMMAVPVQTEPSVTFGVSRALFEDVYYCCDGRNYDLAPDGERFLMLKAEDAVRAGRPAR